MSINFEIKLKRENKIYYEGELLTGCVQFQCPVETKHDGIVLTLEGMVNLHLSNSKSVGLMEAAFYNSLKPITILNSTYELSAPGKLFAGVSEFHFEFPLACKKEPRILYETYHGIFIYINYQLRCDVKRSFLAKSLHKIQQFCIQYKRSPSEAVKLTNKEVHFSISPDSLQKNMKERITMPRFLITGKLERTEFCLTQPLKGQLTVQHTEAAIKSIELQLLRIETCGSEEGYAKDATEIETIQIADGNVCPKLDIPLYMILPRLFTCPTLITKNFKIEFEVNLVIIFKDDYLISENFPIVLHRLHGNPI
ncbi:vacuolar protein sorting-associated protein 26C [Glossina fuscipes]|uniref:Vacuolar protein sorting-associated protein 26C n=1 Tax=Glossina fuscipes TaxID=7396 RepID=A0A8U0W2Z1_9MUSC|nr:vacuolar protein sorting-associated protein 26C [Glossina fuscipes]KAI9588115.1 hypothetical protein GQX74_003961 [Glossina fuscipes]